MLDLIRWCHEGDIVATRLEYKNSMSTKAQETMEKRSRWPK
ncbi:hypothetical protein PANA5342_pPANA10113 (plasmid) [Pantoea ananatis LMG 5342]|nr:hypothetical protein PANA5342_pPANA10113 [Pantoea ananatis LMG 5342]